ncbi:MAG: CBS domain-containing protein [Sphingomonadales bacterium]|jgi:CBS domain-containing protein
MLASIITGKPPVIHVTRETPVSAIAALLHRHRIGVVLVMAGDSIEGLVSERDIVRCLHSHGPAVHDAHAQDVMTSPVVTVGPRMSVADAMEMMTDRRFRHLPVVDDSGRLLGLVSIGDLVKRRIEDAEAEAAAMKDYIAS